MSANEKGSNKLYLIGLAAEKVGLSAKTIRYYEQIGTLRKPNRRSTGYSTLGYRTYTEADLVRMRFVKRLRELGLPLAEIKTLLESVDAGCCGSAQPTFVFLITEKLGQIEEQMHNLRLLKSELLELKEAMKRLSELKKQPAASCPGGEEPSECILELSG